MSARAHRSQPVVLTVPEAFEVTAVDPLVHAISALPAQDPVILDFGAVQVCHAFVFSMLLSRLVALRRRGTTRLKGLNPQQRLFAAHLKLKELGIVEEI